MRRGFVYIPDKAFRATPLSFNTGADFGTGSLPIQDDKAMAGVKAGTKGHLAAWDPVAQKEVWRVQYDHPWNSGVLATAGDLVFAGSGAGEISAYKSDTGSKLWTGQTQAGVLAAPMTYEVNGEQYVAIEVGYGGAYALAAGPLALDSHVKGNSPRVLAFKLNGNATLPAVVPEAPRVLQPPPNTANVAVVTEGKARYHRFCGTCHGDSAVSGGVLPDLRYSSALGDPALWNQIVHDGGAEVAGHGPPSHRAQSVRDRCDSRLRHGTRERRCGPGEKQPEGSGCELIFATTMRAGFRPVLDALREMRSICRRAANHAARGKGEGAWRANRSGVSRPKKRLRRPGNWRQSAASWLARRVTTRTCGSAACRPRASSPTGCSISTASG